MSLHAIHTLHSVVLWLTAAVAAYLSVLIWRRRAHTPGAGWFAAGMAASTLWALAYIAEAATLNMPWRLLWARLEYVPSLAVPILMLGFAACYSGRQRCFTRRRSLLLWIPVLLSQLILWSPAWMHWVWVDVRREMTPSGAIIVFDHGPGFYMFTGYAYLCGIIALYMLLRHTLSAPRIYQRQSLLVGTGAVVVIGVALSYTLDLLPVRGVDYTPAGMLIFGLMVYQGLVRHRFMDIAPVARAELFMQLPQAVVVIDHLQRIVDLNPAARHVLDVSDTAVGLPARDVFDRWPALRDRLNTCADDNQPVEHPDGKHHYLVTCAPLRHQSGCLVLLQDVTANVDAERRTLAEQELAEQRKRMESLGLMASAFAHDLNNLLTTVYTNADVISMGRQLDAEAQEAMIALQRASRQAADMCEQMLDYAGKGVLRQEPVDLNGLAIELPALVRPALKPGVAFSLHTAESLPMTMGDPLAISRVAQNLVINAMQATDIGGKVILSTGVQNYTAGELDDALPEPLPPGRYLHLEVTDTGSGMDEATLSRLFEPFFTTKRQGRGVGLSSLIGAVRMHRGAVLVRSQAGVGSRFRVLLPIVEPVARGAGVPREGAHDGLPAASLAVAPRAACGTGDGRTARGVSPMIVVADDEESVRTAMVRVLRMSGYDVLEFADARTLLEWFEAHVQRPDAVLLDQGMGDMEGTEAAAQLRALRPALPVVICSGYRDVPVDRIPGSVPVEFLLKPFSGSQMRAALQRAGSPAPPIVRSRHDPGEKSNNPSA